MYKKNEKLMKEFVYDFSVLGGATGTINLTSVDPNSDLLPEGFVIDSISVHTSTAITSGGTPTITIGNGADADGYFVDVFASASAANSSFGLGQLAGALVWDDTNDVAKKYRITSSSTTQDVSIVVGTAAITAGKFSVLFEGHIPADAAGHVDQ